MAADTAFALAHYGNPATKDFSDKHMVLYTFPAWLAAVFPKYLGKPVTRQWVNKDIIAPLESVFKELITTGLVKELKTFDGLWVIRQKRGVAEYSIHSWGCAVDFNASLNPLGVKQGSRAGMFSTAFLNVWRKHGWTAGADFNDVMHFQYLKGYAQAK